MRTISLLLLLSTVLAFAACKPKPVEVSSVARAQAAHLAAEADVQSRLRDYAGAEKLLAQSVELNPHVAEYWSILGRNRMLLGDKSGAKKAYKQELALVEEAAKKNPKDVNLQMAALRPLVFLNRIDDARKLLEKIARENPSQSVVREMIETKAIDRLLQDPEIQKVMVK